MNTVSAQQQAAGAAMLPSAGSQGVVQQAQPAHPLQPQQQVPQQPIAPNHKSQIASDLKSRSPNRKNFPQIAVSGSSNRTFKSRDLWFDPLF